MLTCPMCKKALPESTQQCPRCSTDLSLLTDYVEQLHDGVARADDLTRQGQLDEAVWAYLEVLEVDPDNAAARRQVGRVATAVRQFDRTAPGRRWLSQVRGEDGDDAASRLARWFRAGFVGLLVVLAFTFGYSWGSRSGEETPNK